MKIGENEDEYGLFLPGMAVAREFSHGNRGRDEPHEECRERDLKGGLNSENSAHRMFATVLTGQGDKDRLPSGI